MTNHEHCGAPYVHNAHTWQELSDGDRIMHWCDGEDPDETDVAQQDDLFERGAY